MCEWISQRTGKACEVVIPIHCPFKKNIYIVEKQMFAWGESDEELADQQIAEALKT